MALMLKDIHNLHGHDGHRGMFKNDNATCHISECNSNLSLTSFLTKNFFSSLFGELVVNIQHIQQLKKNSNLKPLCARTFSYTDGKKKIQPRNARLVVLILDVQDG